MLRLPTKGTLTGKLWSVFPCSADKLDQQDWKFSTWAHTDCTNLSYLLLIGVNLYANKLVIWSRNVLPFLVNHHCQPLSSQTVKMITFSISLRLLWQLVYCWENLIIVRSINANCCPHHNGIVCSKPVTQHSSVIKLLFSFLTEKALLNRNIT